MGLSSAVRLGTNLVLFILIARYLGPEEFGHYMFWYGATFLCALLASYGLSNMLLKEIAQHPENVASTVSESLSLRLTLSLGIFLCAIGSSLLVDRSELLIILLLVHLLEIISDTFYVAYRAVGHYARESQLAACAAIVQLVFVAMAVATNQRAGIIALAHLAGKIVQLAMILPVSRRAFGIILLQPIYTTFKLAMRTKAYAIDHLLGSAFGNIDSVILRIYTSFDAVGIYQSGMRIFQGGAHAAPILANVFLPEMAKQVLCKEKYARTALVLQASFLIYGISFGFALAYFPNQIIDLAFGEDYRPLAALLPLFGFLFFIRFFVASWGVILTAVGQQRYRAKVIAIYLMFLLFIGSYLSHAMQAQGWLIAAILANLLLAIMMMTRVIQLGFGESSNLSIGTLLLGCLLFATILFGR